MPLWLHDIFGEEIRSIAAGGVVICSAALLEEQRCWVMMMIISDPAEGYHRGVKLERTRASSASTPFIFATLRLEQNLVLVEKWLALPVFREAWIFNFVNWSRVLQTKSVGFDRRKRFMSKQAKLRQVYRLDTWSRVDWSHEGSYLAVCDAEKELKYTDHDQLTNGLFDSLAVSGTMYTVSQEVGDDLVFELLRINRLARITHS